MWTFPGLLFLFFVSAFPTAWIVRALSPWFWRNLPAPVHSLLVATSPPEIDNAVYISFILIFSLIFIINVVISSLLFRRYGWFSSFVTNSVQIVALYLLIVPTTSLLTLDQIHIYVLVVSALISLGVARVWHLRFGLLETIVGFAAIRYGGFLIWMYDTGANPLLGTFDYYFLFVGVLIALFGYVGLHAYGVFESFASRVTRRRLLLLLSLGILLTILYLMPRAHDPVDIYFTFLPAYHVVHGGTPLVSMMSQYGLLYLVPWITWIIAFPQAPVSFGVGVIITTLLLMAYYLFFLITVARLMKYRLVFVLTAFASFYYTLLIRWYGFPDPVSLVSTPAFTPLRFGVFIFPLWSLISYCKDHKRTHMIWFLITSAIGFFYSFDIGVGLIGAGIGVAIVDALAQKCNRLNYLVTYLGVLLGTLSVSVIVLALCTYVRSGSLPDFGLYVFYTKQFGLGFLMLPIGQQTVSLLLLGVAFVGGFFGLYRVLADKEPGGLVFGYLALIVVFGMPYYMGRSILPTLYNISLPFVLLCGMLVDWSVVYVGIHRRNIAAWVMMILCSSVLIIGGLRAFVITGGNVLHAAEIVESAYIFSQKTLFHWEIQQTPQYGFLKRYLPPQCPLVSFDQNDYELLPAMGVPPAFQYAFVFGFTTKEQVDTLVPHRGASRVCLFINDSAVAAHFDATYGTYVYFLERYGPSLRKIAEDPLGGFTLYELPIQ